MTQPHFDYEDRIRAASLPPGLTFYYRRPNDGMRRLRQVEVPAVVLEGLAGGMVNHEVIVDMDKVERILVLADAARGAWVILMGLVSRHNFDLRQRRKMGE